MRLQEVLSNGRGSLNYCQNLLKNIKSQEVGEAAAVHGSHTVDSLLVESHGTGTGIEATESLVSERQVEPQPSLNLADSNLPQPGNQPIVVPGWCKCGNCRDMQDPVENVCCNKKECTTHYQIFGVLCLDRNVLENVIKTRCDILSDDYEFSSNEYRKAGYRQYTIWQHGKLGKGNRRVCPSCVVLAIRRAYPSEDGNYMGFKRS